jgi:hypothetical protein
MALRFEEIDWQDTARGEISLRRRVDPTLGVDVYEVKLGEEFLMSSLFTVAEIELARIGLAQVTGDRIDVLVGGLGLGYTAVAALADPRVQTLTVIDAIAPVINWHQRELLPDTAGLATDSRTHLLEGDFFALVDGPVGFGAGRPDHYDAILLDMITLRDTCCTKVIRRSTYGRVCNPCGDTSSGTVYSRSGQTTRRIRSFLGSCPASSLRYPRTL